ncbi:MAG: hypothetical protein KKE17_11640 [Proteobacteria bacterium]|nr:hypothetical protein [Pseudomonadota bacterium]MBU1710647.1 hypothetical protein [Pseudomonadota bacterium]
MLRVLQNEKGSVLNIALLVLLTLTLIVIYMSQTTTTEIEIAANEKFYNMSFYNADAGVYASGKTIDMAYDLLRVPTIPSTAVPPLLAEIPAFTLLDNNFYNEMHGWGPVDSDTNPVSNPEIVFTLDVEGRNIIQANIWRKEITPASGSSSGAEFASGGSSGGAPTTFTILGVNSVGYAPKNASTRISAGYAAVN